MERKDAIKILKKGADVSNFGNPVDFQKNVRKDRSIDYVEAPTKNRPKKYMPMEEVLNNLRNAKEGSLRRLNSIDGACNIFVVSIDWEKMCLNYAITGSVFRDLKIKVRTVKIKRIKAFRELK